VRSHRLDIEPFHEQIKQFLGFGVSGVSPESRKHLTLVFVVNSLLKSIELSYPNGDLPMDSYKDVQFFRYSAERDQPTFGQRCRRIVFEVFHEMIQKIHQWVDTKSKTVTEIFQTLFQRLLYA